MQSIYLNHLLLILIFLPFPVLGQEGDRSEIDSQKVYSVYRIEIGLDSLVFPLDKWELTSWRKAEIDSIAKTISPNYKKIEIEVIERLNKNATDSLHLLSRKRVNSILDVLVQNGLERTMISFQIRPYVRKEESRPVRTRFSAFNPDIFILKIYY